MAFSSRIGCYRLCAAVFFASAVSDAASLAGAVEPIFSKDGLQALKVNGTNVLKPGRPQLIQALFEQTGVDAQGMRTYAFTRTTGPGKASYRADTKTAIEEFSWGSVAVMFKPGADRLDLAITIVNTSAKTLADFELVLGTFEFPTEPKGWPVGRGAFANSLDNLAIVTAEAGPVGMLACNASMEPPFGLGFGPAAVKGKPVYPLIVRGGVFATEPGTRVLEPHGVPRVPPGKTLALEITLRGAPAGPNPYATLPDVVEKFRAAHKPALEWSDRRPIGMIMNASSARQHQSATNPRGWLNDPQIDVISAAGKTAFRRRMLAAAAQGVKTIQETGGQGMIFWDVEGEQNPHPITYIGDPSLAKKLAPEMDEVADEYFKVYRDAGLRTGVTLRPSQVYFNEQKKLWDHGTGSDGGPGRGDFYPALRPKDIPWWKYYPLVERLSDKIAYAKKRWGCTLFYIDTNGVFRQVGEDQKFVWHLLEAQVWKRLRELHPDVLIIPELQRDDQTFHAAYWAYTAPYMETKMKSYRTPPAVRELLPNAFSVVNIGDGDLAAHRAEIKAGVEKGDILMFRGWFADHRNGWVKSLYEEVKREKR